MSAKPVLAAPSSGLITTFANDLRTKAAIQSMVAGESRMQVARNQRPSALLNNWAALAQSDAVPLQQQLPPPPPAPPPPIVPSQLGPWDTGYVGFPTGVPVGGSASLALFQDGSYAFNGHFHDSGAPSYNVQFSWVVVSGAGRAYTFSGTWHMAGTFESGSRDANWTNQGKNDDLAAHWGELTDSWTCRWSAAVNWDEQAFVDSVVNALKTAGTVIATVVAIVG